MTTVPRSVLRAALLAALSVVLLLGGTPAGAGAPTDDDPALRQRVSGRERVVTGRATIDSGHVDLGPRVRGGRWSLDLRDDTAQPPVWRRPGDVVLRVGDEALTSVPATKEYEFLQAPEGSQVHVVPQTERPGVVWLGWNTQDPQVVRALRRGATLRLLGVTGPGRLVLFLQDGAFGAPRVLWDSERPGPQDLFAELDTHVHANWVFTRPGAYTARVEVRGEDRSGKTRSARGTLRFAVGDGTPVEAAADAAVAEDGGAPAAATPTDGGGASRVPLAVWLGGGALVLVALVLGVLSSARRSARMRREAFEEGAA